MDARFLLPGWLACTLFFHTSVFGQAAAVPPNAAPATPKGKMAAANIWLTDRVDELKMSQRGPFVRLADGSLLSIGSDPAFRSTDEGNSWQVHARLNRQTDRFAIGVGRDILRTRKGTIIVPFSNIKEQKWTWTPAIRDAPGATLPTYVIRTVDDGKTWLQPQKLHGDWTGDNSAIIQTSTGRVVLTTMNLLHNPGRHAVLTFYSDDEGKTWNKSHVLDLGGIGDHSGTMEAALEELRDGRLWLLIRTNWGRFWNAYSTDGGQSWREIGPSTIDASTSPAFLRRLASGRIAMVWNRYLPQNVRDYPLSGGDGQTTDVPASWHRAELSLALSSDDGKTWTDPVVIARKPGGNLSYPHIFEVKPGRLWIHAQDGVACALNEADFISKSPKR